MVTASFWSGKRVLVTGHTGFKGGWLALWLDALGGRVSGLALPPDTEPNLFGAARVAEAVDSTFGDIRSAETALSAMRHARPEIVFHLAAQPLVRRSYHDPLATFATNVMGTAHVLEAARQTPSVRVAVVITSDKCYRDSGEPAAHLETDPMGGHDPYSSSKGCAELVAAAYAKSFLDAAGVRLATARAGNVVGGGDWAEDRLVPDCVRAFVIGGAVRLRAPHSVRPWQHVLDPLAGYLLLAQKLWESEEYGGSYNFGPPARDAASVSDVAAAFARTWREPARVEIDTALADLHESGYLALDCTRARSALGWQPRLPLQEAIEWTAAWYRGHADGADARKLTLEQIEEYARRPGRTEEAASA